MVEDGGCDNEVVGIGDKLHFSYIRNRALDGVQPMRTGIVFQFVEDELPEPGPNEVRVKILAVGVSFSEVLMRHGQYPGAPAMPFTPGYDMVGVVEKLGTGCRRSRWGRRSQP